MTIFPAGAPFHPSVHILHIADVDTPSKSDGLGLLVDNPSVFDTIPNIPRGRTRPVPTPRGALSPHVNTPRYCFSFLSFHTRKKQ